MTDRQFVKKTFPFAVLDYKCSVINRYSCWYNIMTAPYGQKHEVIGSGRSPKKAWESAKKHIKALSY